MLQFFSQKLDSDSETLSLHNQKKQKATNFIISLKITFLSAAALLQFQQPTQIPKVIEFLGNGFLETISFQEPKLLWYIGKNGRERRLEKCQIEMKHQWKEFQAIVSKTSACKFS